MLTAKQEAFVQGVLKGASYSDAYRAVYDVSRMKVESVHDAASKLALSGGVAQRLAKVEERAVTVAATRLSYTLEDAMREAQEDRALAHGVGQAGAAVAATGLRAKLMGLLIERKEVRVGLLEDTDLHELAAMRERLRDVVVVEAEVIDVVPQLSEAGNRPGTVGALEYVDG